jgi:hypothetical protein
MTDRTMKGWRPSFSLKTLSIVVTLVCCYVACWGPTKSQGEEDVFRYEFGITDEDSSVTDWIRSSDTKAAIPLVVGVDSEELAYLWSTKNPPRRHFYFWFFGYVKKLPFELDAELPDCVW